MPLGKLPLGLTSCTWFCGKPESPMRTRNEPSIPKIVLMASPFLPPQVPKSETRIRASTVTARSPLTLFFHEIGKLVCEMLATTLMSAAPLKT